MDRRERLRRLALETIDLSKDPYFIKTHLGSYECKLCLTVHVNDGSYLAHTQGKKHQTNLARRAAMEQKSGIRDPSTALLSGLYGTNVPVKKNFMNDLEADNRVDCLSQPEKIEIQVVGAGSIKGKDHSEICNLHQEKQEEHGKLLTQLAPP